MSEPETIEPTSGGSRRLLVLAVDDDAILQMNTAAMLEDLGHTVVEASNGVEALDVIRVRHDIDLVVTDYAMPRMNGRDLAEAIARERPGLAVILASGYAELPSGGELDVERLSKPYSMDDLARAIARALTRAPASR